MLQELLYIMLLTLTPFLELRASIPYGILVLGQNPLLVFLLAIMVNIALAAFLYYILDFIVRSLTKIKIFNKLYLYYVKRTQKKIHGYVERYGDLGLAIFIGIPLPGSGVYSGALAAYLLGLSFKKFIIASAIGVVIAGTIVAVVSVFGLSLFDIFIKAV